MKKLLSIQDIYIFKKILPYIEELKNYEMIDETIFQYLND